MGGVDTTIQTHSTHLGKSSTKSFDNVRLGHGYPNSAAKVLISERIAKEKLIFFCISDEKVARPQVFRLRLSTYGAQEGTQIISIPMLFPYIFSPIHYITEVSEVNVEVKMEVKEEVKMDNGKCVYSILYYRPARRALLPASNAGLTPYLTSWML